jgi:FkbM family methyltransferase
MNKIKSIILTVLKRIYIVIFPKKITDENLLIEAANKIPRYTPHKFNYRNYKLTVNDFISVAYQIKEYFGDERMKFNTTSNNPVIIDCGANVGVSILYFKYLFPLAKIEGFEPDPKTVKLLKDNLDKNKVTDVIIHEKAIWKNNNGVSFGIEGADGGSIFLEGKSKLEIASIRLKDVLTKYEHIDLLKIDIEGAEVEVIKDCNEELKKVKNIFIEYHSWISNKQELDILLKILTENGFRYYIHSIGSQYNKPFLNIDSYNGMDVQLDIYAVNKKNN